MLTRFVNRFVPRGLLPRRYNTEQVVRWVVEKGSGKAIEEWFALAEMTDTERRVFFDLIDEKFGKQLNSGDEVIMTQAFKDVVTELARHVSERIAEHRGALPESPLGGS
jgi:hypothetical protein